MDPLDLELPIAGRRYFVSRSMEMARRVESVVGPIGPFAKRLEGGEVTFAEISRVYFAILRDETDVPDVEKIDGWLFEIGVHAPVHKGTAWFLYSLIVGSKVLAVEQSRIAATMRAAERGGDGSPASPFVPTGASITSS